MDSPFLNEWQPLASPSVYGSSTMQKERENVSHTIQIESHMINNSHSYLHGLETLGRCLHVCLVQ